MWDGTYVTHVQNYTLAPWRVSHTPGPETRGRPAERLARLCRMGKTPVEGRVSYCLGRRSARLRRLRHMNLSAAEKLIDKPVETRGKGFG